MAKRPPKKPTGPKKPEPPKKEPAGIVGRGEMTLPRLTMKADGGMDHGGRGAQTMPTPTQQARGPQVVEIGMAEEHDEALPITAKVSDEATAASDSSSGDVNSPLDLNFDPISKIVTINESGEIEFVLLYSTIKSWEASTAGIIYPTVVEGSGNIELPDGTRTPRCMILKGGWRLSTNDSVSITGGYVTGRDDDGKAYHPVVEDARDRIRLMHEEQNADDTAGVGGGDAVLVGDLKIKVAPNADMIFEKAPNADATKEPLIAGEGGQYEFSGSDANLDVAPTIRQQATRHRVTVETAAEIEEVARQRFANAPAVAIAEAKQAKVIATALLIAIDDLRPNNPEAGSAKDLLAKQIDALDRIIVVFESGDDTQMALQTYRELLGDVLRELLKALKNESVIRGLLAVAAISVAGIAGVQLSVLGEGLIAGAIVGPGVIKAVGKIVKDLKSKGK